MKHARLLILGVVGTLLAPPASAQSSASKPRAPVIDAFEAANAAEKFTGEGGAITSTINSRSQILKKTEAVPDFDIEGAFGEAAKIDFDRAAQMARGFKGEAARVNAIIAISRAVINEQLAPTPSPAKKR